MKDKIRDFLVLPGLCFIMLMSILTWINQAKKMAAVLERIDQVQRQTVVFWDDQDRRNWMDELQRLNPDLKVPPPIRPRQEQP